jgi:hypothetical protein
MKPRAIAEDGGTAELRILTAPGQHQIIAIYQPARPPPLARHFG